MALLHVIHALPNAFLPAAGEQLKLKGLTLEQAQQMVDRAGEIISHVRYEDFCEILTSQLGRQIPASATNAPSPHTVNATEAFLLCSRSFDGTILYAQVYNCNSEDADHAWRYEMTKFA